jgi:predicted nucleic acid-binding protein
VKPKVYLESSFISYLAGRLSPDLIALQRQLSSQRWWEQKRGQFELVTSQTVHEECRQGDQQAVDSRMAILNQTTLLPLTQEILEIARRLIDPGPFPKKAAADAIHVAAATAYGCEYLLTWNFKHINNARIKREAMRIIEEYGYQPTTICTPEELMGSDDQAEG